MKGYLVKKTKTSGIRAGISLVRLGTAEQLKDFCVNSHCPEPLECSTAKPTASETKLLCLFLEALQHPPGSRIQPVKG